MLLKTVILSYCRFFLYRVSNLHADLSWVGLTFILVCHHLTYSCAATSAKFPSAQAELSRQWNTKNSSQPNPVHEQMGHPVEGEKEIVDF